MKEAHPAGAPIKKLLADATHALTVLDGERLEELACSCRGLLENFQSAGAVEKRYLAREAAEALPDLAKLARTLAATRANLEVVRRAIESSRGVLEYRPGMPGLVTPEASHGDH